jgi:thiamine biosynthesis lipoprotein
VSGEVHRSFACFGGTAAVHVGGRSRGRGADDAAVDVEACLLEAHHRLSRFIPESELCRLNADPRDTVPVSRLLLGVAASARWAGLLSDGLVDATLVDEIEQAGYGESLAGNRDRPGPGRNPASDSPRPASPSPSRGWRRIVVDRGAGTVSRPPGIRIDSGGIAKGLLADLVGEALEGYSDYAVDCCGDVRIGGSGGRARRVLVEDPAGGEPLHEVVLLRGGVATSGVGRRTWVGADGAPAHHLLDPSSGEPVHTGVAQSTAIAPTAFLAEVYSKCALLSGRDRARERLPYGGVLVMDDGSVEVVPASAGRTEAFAG